MRRRPALAPGGDGEQTQLNRSGGDGSICRARTRRVRAGLSEGGPAPTDCGSDGTGSGRVRAVTLRDLIEMKREVG